ncbi:MAG TPA: lipase family protein [Acidimicrobiales bacterium]
MHVPLRSVPAALLATSLVLAACSGNDGGGSDAGPADDRSAAAAAGTTTSLAPFEGDDFYEVPDPLPEGGPGTLIRYEPVDTGAGDEGPATFRMMYLSESVAGDPIAVTGLAAIPDGDAPPGGRPTLTISHGTTGIADECAPSRSPRASEGLLFGPAADRGYLVALSDYEGLGTPGRHPYLVGESEGRSVLDAAKAAARLPGADAGRELAIIGYSQGGHGALWAGQLAESWSPDHEVLGTVAGAPATELPVIMRAGSAGPVAGFLMMIIAGFAEAYPEADASDVLTAAGETALDRVDEGCVGDVVGGFASAREQLVEPEAASAEPWASLMAENDPGRVVADAPVLVLHSAADDLVPAALSEIMVDRMCELGQVVERRVYEDGLGHAEAAPGAMIDGLEWLDGLAEGAEPVSTCA